MLSVFGVNSIVLVLRRPQDTSGDNQDNCVNMLWPNFAAQLCKWYKGKVPRIKHSWSLNSACGNQYLYFDYCEGCFYQETNT